MVYVTISEQGLALECIFLEENQTINGSFKMTKSPTHLGISLPSGLWPCIFLGIQFQLLANGQTILKYWTCLCMLQVHSLHAKQLAVG